VASTVPGSPPSALLRVQRPEDLVRGMDLVGEGVELYLLGLDDLEAGAELRINILLPDSTFVDFTTHVVGTTPRGLRVWADRLDPVALEMLWTVASS